MLKHEKEVWLKLSDVEQWVDIFDTHAFLKDLSVHISFKESVQT